MTYIKREIEGKILALNGQSRPYGVILQGVVGVGKTTVVEQVLSHSANGKQVFRYSGDHTAFRAAVSKDSAFLVNEVRSSTQQPAIIFVDEVQRCPDVFDALKLAFDSGKISFIVSGSNPAYLATEARRRLQRRAELINLMPFSPLEILGHAGFVDMVDSLQIFGHILFESKTCEVPNLGLTLSDDIVFATTAFLKRGGLPLSHLAPSERESSFEIQKIVERGFETIWRDTDNLSDPIKIYLAQLHSQEFTYQGIFQSTGLKKRDAVNHVIQDLEGHGYLVAKKPIFPGENRRSYLTVYSYTDPGIISYLQPGSLSDEQVGRRIEGHIHARLEHLLAREPFKSKLGYYKPHIPLDESKEQIRFLPGEIDFIVEVGQRIVPIEVKATKQIGQIDTKLLEAFVQKHRLSYGIVLYGGVPIADPRRKLIYWPWWLV